MPINETAQIVGHYEVPAWVMEKVNTFLPEKTIINAEYLADGLKTNLELLAASEVEVIFIHEGAAFKDALGYFTYDIDREGKIQITGRGLVFPNASYDPQAQEAKASPYAGLREGGGKLFRGDYTYLMDAAGRKIRFSARTRIGFFLVPDGWKGGTVDSWDENNPNLPFDNPKDNSKREKGVVTTIESLNPEKVIEGGKYEQSSRHFVTFGIKNESKDFLNGADFLLLCAEDMLRPHGDQDFNDCVFIVRAEVDICRYPESHCDDCTPKSIPERSDGLICYDDEYQFPGVYERYETQRDSDMNDFVAYYRFTELTCPDDIKKIMGTFHFICRGAWYDHDFGIHIPNVSSLPGTVKIEYFLSPGRPDGQPEPIFQCSLSEVHNNRITIFQGTRRYLPSPEGGEGFTNTRPQDPLVTPCSARFVIEFERLVKRTEIGGMTMPYDPFLLVYTSGDRVSDGVHWDYDCHLNGMNRFPDAPSGLPEERGKDSFRRLQDGMPYCFITNRSFPIVVERENIAEAYPKYRNWEPPFSAATAEKVWMADQRTDKVLEKQIAKPERGWTISA